MRQQVQGITLAAALTGAAGPVFADYVPIRDRAEFLGVITQGDLTRMGIRLTVTPDGAISGRAFGRDVSGKWTWQDGYFCYPKDKSQLR